MTENVERQRDDDEGWEERVRGIFIFLNENEVFATCSSYIGAEKRNSSRRARFPRTSGFRLAGYSNCSDDYYDVVVHDIVLHRVSRKIA